MSLKRKSAARQPYEGYGLPKSSEKGGQFVDFNKILKKKSVRKVMKRRKHADISTK